MGNECYRCIIVYISVKSNVLCPTQLLWQFNACRNPLRPSCCRVGFDTSHGASHGAGQFPAELIWQAAGREHAASSKCQRNLVHLDCFDGRPDKLGEFTKTAVPALTLDLGPVSISYCHVTYVLVFTRKRGWNATYVKWNHSSSCRCQGWMAAPLTQTASK